MSTGTVEQIKSRLGVEEVLSGYIQLEKSGKNFKARCPFHNEKTPSFYVSPDRGSYYCFGCGAKGDIFTFVQEFEGVDFMGSLKILAEKAGVELKFEKKEEKSEKERLYAVMESATLFYEDSFLAKDDKEAEEARKYVSDRGVNDETRKSFRIGFAKNGWRNLYTHLKSKGYSDTDIEKTGLCKKPEEGGVGYYDRFRDRIMFPISDSSGRVIAFSGRILHPDDKSAKYINSPDTPLYDKSTVLYGIDKAKTDIRKKNYTILVEGQMDLIMSHQMGIKNTVAVSGTAMAEDTMSAKTNTVNNLGVIRRLSQNVIIAFDSDEAGQKATMRASVIALNMGMDVKVASIEGGKDPADLVKADPELWKSALRGALPVVEFALQSVLKRGLDARKIPKAIKAEVLPFVVALPSGMEQAHSVKVIAERLGINEASVWQDLKDIQISNRDSQNSANNANTANESPPSGQKSRGDIAVKRLYGLMYLLEEKSPNDKERISQSIQKISGKSIDQMEESAYFKENKAELVLESEIMYGESKNLDKTISELILVYEEEILKSKFAKAMSELSKSENKKDEERSKELIKECQDFSKRLTEIKEEFKKL